MFEKLLKISELYVKNEIETTNFVIVYELDEEELLFLDKDLYVRKNGNLKNFVKNEEIELTLNEVKFLIKKKF
jgi:hypothetical protein